MEEMLRNRKKSKVVKMAINEDFRRTNGPKDKDNTDNQIGHGLSNQQTQMFKEVFTLLDREGTGSVNAEELFYALKEIDINISLEEIVAVLSDLDKDGNGEIDLNEFLMAMSETDRYIETMLTQPDGTQQRERGEFSKRQTLFFTAITSFALKNSLGEIERYYANKVRQAPHVIGCYSAGVRLIGLNDKQLEQEMRRMRKEAKQYSSPYAQPLPFIRLKKKVRKQEKNVIPAERIHSSSSESEEIDQPAKRERMRTRHGIQVDESSDILKMLQQLAKTGKVSKAAAKKLAEENFVSKIPKNPKRKTAGRGSLKKQRGWVTPSMELGQVPLPVIRVEQGHSREFNFGDMPDIKERVREAMNDYYTLQRRAHSRTASYQWHKLLPDQIKSRKLRDKFTECYRAYLPINEREVVVTCHWMPEPRFNARLPRTYSLDGAAEISKASARRLVLLAEHFRTNNTKKAQSPTSPVPPQRAQSTPPRLPVSSHRTSSATSNPLQPATPHYTRCRSQLTY